MLLEVLHLALVLLGLLERCKCSEVAAFAGRGVLLAGVQTEFTGFEFANHAPCDAAVGNARCLRIAVLSPFLCCLTPDNVSLPHHIERPRARNNRIVPTATGLPPRREVWLVVHSGQGKCEFR